MSRASRAEVTALVAATLLLSGPAHAASGGWGLIIFQAINLAILLFLLVKFAGKPLNRAIKGKAERVEKDIAEARRLHEEASAMLSEYEGKLAGLDARAEELIAQYRADGEAEKARLIAAAEAEAERIRKDAERSARNEIDRARARLEAEVVDLAIGAAEQAIKSRLTPADQRRLTADYLGQLEATLRG